MGFIVYKSRNNVVIKLLAVYTTKYDLKKALPLRNFLLKSRLLIFLTWLSPATKFSFRI